MGAAEAGRDVMFTGAHKTPSVPVVAPQELSDKLSLLPDMSAPASAAVQLMHKCKLITCTAGEMVFPWMFEDFAALRPFKVSSAWPVNIASYGRRRPPMCI